MVFVPAGEFVLGTDDTGIDFGFQLCNERFADCERVWFEDEGPPHLVTMSASWIDQTEVTNAQYQECVSARVCRPPAETLSATRSSYYNKATYARYPVVFVAWKDAETYCAWAGARLPTEAEWVYAARGPEGRVFPWGNTFDGTKLNFCDSNCVFDGVDWNDPDWDDGHQDTAPVGSYQGGASWVGALDMSGNVVEWLADWYGPNPPSGDTNPTGPDSGERRSLAGGSWYDTVLNERSTARGGWAPDTRHSDLGFRCAANS